MCTPIYLAVSHGVAVLPILGVFAKMPNTTQMMWNWVVKDYEERLSTCINQTSCTLARDRDGGEEVRTGKGQWVPSKWKDSFSTRLVVVVVEGAHMQKCNRHACPKDI